MKESMKILLFTCLAYACLATAQNAVPCDCIVFQPDNRTTILSVEDVNTIWQTIEKLAGNAVNTMSREDFLAFATNNSLQPTGSNLREDNNVRQKLSSNAPCKTLLFTRITRWGNHFNLSMEKVALPSFRIDRATLPLSAKINTLGQLLDKLPGLMNELGLVEKVLQPPDKPLMLVIPPASDQPLQIFCTALQKHLSDAGVKSVVSSQDAATNDGNIRISIDFDTFESNSQTLDLPMQKRQLVKTSINLAGKMSMMADGQKTVFSFSKSESQTGKPENAHSNENAVLDAVARDSALQIIQKLNAKPPAP